MPEAKPHQDKPKKTTEELQLEEVKRLQKEAKKTLQQSRRSFQHLVKTTGPVVVKGSKPTTQAVEFNFHTKDRDRSRPGSATKTQEGVNPTNFPQTLRNFNSTDNFNPNFVSCLHSVCVCVVEGMTPSHMTLSFREDDTSLTTMCPKGILYKIVGVPWPSPFSSLVYHA